MHRALGFAHATTIFHLARLRDERGQGTVEYIGLILLIAGVMATVMTAKGGGKDIGTTIVGKLKDTVTGLGGAAGGGS